MASWVTICAEKKWDHALDLARVCDSYLNPKLEEASTGRDCNKVLDLLKVWKKDATHEQAFNLLVVAEELVRSKLRSIDQPLLSEHEKMLKSGLRGAHEAKQAMRSALAEKFAVR